MYPPKQCHSVSIRDSSESRVLRPSLQIVAIAGLAVAFFLFLFTLQFDGAQLDISHDDIQMFGPRPYFLDFIDRGLKDVYNETLGFGKVFIVGVPTRFDKIDINTLATSLSGFRYTAIEGLSGDSVPRVSLPPTFDADFNTKNIGLHTIGAWRSELNAVRQIVTDRLSTALILEDDVDWDVAIKNQLVDIARGARFFSNQTKNFHSPYGDGWDVLWLGHCKMVPRPNDHRRFILHHDPTVPPQDKVHAPDGSPDAKEWENNGTRIMFTGHGTCSWAYAVSNVGAKRILKAMSIDPFNAGFDNGMGGLCAEQKLNCIGIFPPIFGAFTPSGPTEETSDNSGAHGGWRNKGSTYNIAYSVKLNLDQLIRGEMERVESQWDMPYIARHLSREYIEGNTL